MMNNLPSHQLETKTIKTARESIHYDIPFSRSGEKFNVITPEYLRKRVEYAIERLRERLKMTTAKHLSDRRGPVLESIDEFRARLLTIIDELPPTGITSQKQLAKYCDHTRYALYLFKSDRQRYLNILLQLSEVFYKTEQQIIETLFNLPPESTSPENGNKQNLKELRQICEELDFFLPTKQKFLAQLKTLPTAEEINVIIKEILENFTKVQALLSKFPQESEINLLPDEVRAAIMASLEKYQKAVESFTELQNFLKNISLSIAYPLDFLTQTEGAKEYFTGLVKFKRQTELGPDLQKLETSLIALNGFKVTLETAQNLINDHLATMQMMLEDSAVKNTIFNLSSFNPEKFQFSDECLALFSPSPAAPISTPLISDAAPISTSSIAEQTSEVPSTKPETHSEPATLEIGGKFQWKKATEEAKTAEAVKRLTQHPRLTIINWLYERERWDDLGKLFSLLGYSEIGEAKLAGAVGTGGVYSDLNDLFTRAFPQITHLGNFEKVRLRLEIGETRFRWKGEKVKPEAVHQEIRTRLFVFWPLLEELEKAGQKDLQLQILNLMDKSKFALAGLNISCLGYESSVYPEIETMLNDVFGK